jgi:ferric-dicitrate binding protein FerR (iron transport regulator)
MTPYTPDEDARSPIDPMLVQQLAAEPDGDALHALWDRLGAVPSAVPADPDARAAMRAAVQAAALAPMRAVPVVAPSRRYALMAAAAVLLVAGAATYAATPVRVTAATGTRIRMTLPDGSLAELNGGSTIRYGRGFRRFGLFPAATREVALDGEAFFQVTKNGRRFTVRGAGATVTVLGTHFSVRAWDGSNTNVQVGVEEGRVRVAGNNGSVELGPGEQTRLLGLEAPTPPAVVEAARIAPWRTGGFSVVDEPLRDVLHALSREHGVVIALRTPAAGAVRYTAYYPVPATIERILADLCHTNALRFRATARGFEIY